MDSDVLSSSRGRVRRWDAIVGLGFVLVACAALSPAKLWRPGDVFGPIENPQIAEAMSWWNGRIDLPARLWDTALVEKPAIDASATDLNGGPDKVGGEHPPYEPEAQVPGPADGVTGQHTRRLVYSHFPPMFSILAAAFVPFFGGVPHLGIVLLLVMPVPILAYRLFLTRSDSALDTSILTLGLVMGTSLWPVLENTLRGGNPYVVNQTLAVIGQLIFLGELFGKRRVWPATVGVVIAALSRQLTIAYLLPLTWMAKASVVRNWVARGHAPPGTRASGGQLQADRALKASNAKSSDRAFADTGPLAADPCHTVGLRAKKVFPLLLALAATIGIPMVINTLKFGSPFESGYRFLYNDRPEDQFSRDAERYGIFSTHYISRNLYYMNVGPPDLHTIELEGKKVWRLRSNDWGSGIWWTTPALLFLFPRFRSILSDPAARGLLLAVVAVLAAQACYHSTGYRQHGFNRYSLDFVPGLYLLATESRARISDRPWLLLAVTWSVLYFGWVI